MLELSNPFIRNYAHNQILALLKQLNEMGVKEYSIFDSSKDYPRKRKPIMQEQSALQKAGGRKKYHTGYVAGVFDLFHVGHLNYYL